MANYIVNYNDRISKFRSTERYNEAILECQKAIESFPDNDFYFKVMGDILLQTCEYKLSLESYFNYLERINDRYDLLKGFIRFFQRLIEKDSSNDHIHKIRLFDEINKNRFSIKVTEWLMAYLNTEVIISNEIQLILKLSDDDKSFATFVKKIRLMESDKQNADLLVVFAHCINRTSRDLTKNNDKFIISVLERYKRFQDALTIAYDLFKTDKDSVLIRTIFRICRVINDYSITEKIITEDPKLVEKENFNIQYELFHYFKYLDDYAAIQKCLSKIQRSAQGSLPISRTLYNFYLQLGMIEEAKKIQIHISTFKKGSVSMQSPRYAEQESESEYGVLQTVSNLISEQEHNRQMTALRDLLKGFSHELGQPVTNIRYAIQLHQMKSEVSSTTPDEQAELLTKILNQTERLGKLLRRFSPIVSPKGTAERFMIEDRFTQVFNELKPRMGTITFNVSPGKNYLYGDPIQFDQIISNLIINAIQAINARGVHGNIAVSVTGDKKSTRITFTDNGLGIPKENQRKIFQPFFTTKDPSKGEGGDGLGLYIVWNIVKMFNGSICVNEQYTNGAQFEMKFDKRQEILQ